MNAHDLECFLAVAEELHFGRAAERLHIAQPSVSQAIRRLERDLGGPLFDRSTRAVSLTELGEVFYESGKAAYLQLEKAWAEARNVSRPDLGTMRISFSPDLRNLTLRAVERVLEASPQLVFDIKEFASGGARCEAVRRRDLDAVVQYVAPDIDGLSMVALGATRFSAVVHPHCSLAAEETVCVKRLMSEELVVASADGHPAIQRLFFSMIENAGFDGTLTTMSSIEGAMAYALAGKGVAISLESMMTARPFPPLCQVPISDSPPVEVVAAWNRSSSHPAVPALVDALLQITATDGLTAERSILG